MNGAKITLTYEDLHAPAVEDKIRAQAALASAQIASQRAAAAQHSQPQSRASLWYNTFVNLTIFGLLGGLLAWGTGELVRYFNPDLRDAARALERDYRETQAAGETKRISPERAQQNLAMIDDMGRDNPWYRVHMDTKLTTEVRRAEENQLFQQERVRNRLSDICFYCACGTMIAVSLGMAESVATRNMQGAVIYGSTGMLLGLIGGVVVAFFIDALYHRIGGGQAIQTGSMGKEIIARSISWGVLGLFLAAAPGLVMWNRRKLLFGLIGGLLGGIVGGALFEPIEQQTASPALSRLIAIVAIGAITGIATGIIENAAKTGWLKVTRGLIAGKQFIIYRNPTFIGASPACEIYLFRDPQVAQRHAALHALPGRYEIQDLGGGGGTFINARSITRARLRNNDQVQIGSTCFTFQEKPRS